MQKAGEILGYVVAFVGMALFLFCIFTFAWDAGKAGWNPFFTNVVVIERR